MIFSLPLICLSFLVCKYVKWSAFSQLCSLIFYIYILKEVISEVLNIVEFHFNNYKLACMWEVTGAILWLVQLLILTGVDGLSTVDTRDGLIPVSWKWVWNSKLLQNNSPSTTGENHWLWPSIWKCLRTFMEILSNWNTSWCN